MLKYSLESLLNHNIKIIQFINFLKINGIFVYKCDIYIYLSYLLKVNYNDIPLMLNSKIVIDQKILEELDLLKKGYPLAYIVKSVIFFGHEFYIDERALIPREDTNVLIKKVLDLNDMVSPYILDLCSGSGCIFITLLLEIAGAYAIGLDKSLNALKVAQYNIKKFDLLNRANLICADVSNVEGLFNNKFDIITCNPPYVGMDDPYDKNILYEPKEALFPGDKKGIIYYKKLLPIMNKLCRKGGLIVFEINPFLIKDIMEILLINKIDAHIDYDLSGNPRIIFWKSM